MAHGDYKCCAICDRKLEYIGLNDNFKTDICPECRERTGIATVSQLIKEIKKLEGEELEDFINEIGLKECYYQNEVDDLIYYKKEGEIPEKYNSPEEWLEDIKDYL